MYDVRGSYGDGGHDGSAHTAPRGSHAGTGYDSRNWSPTGSSQRDAGYPRTRGRTSLGSFLIAMPVMLRRYGFIRRAFAIFWLLLAMVCWADAASAQNNWCGHGWNTAWSSPAGGFVSFLGLACSGNRVIGQYNNGIVDGTVTPDGIGGSFFAGHWRRTDGNSGGSCPVGRFVLRLSPAGNVFEGFWTYCEDSPVDPANNGMKRWFWRGVSSGPQSSLPSSGGGGSPVVQGSPPHKGNSPGSSEGETMSDPGQICATVEQDCVPAEGPGPGVHCCNERAREYPNQLGSACVYGRCMACVPHGQPCGSHETGSGPDAPYVCCNPDETCVFDATLVRGVCGAVDAPVHGPP